MHTHAAVHRPASRWPAFLSPCIKSDDFLSGGRLPHGDPCALCDCRTPAYCYASLAPYHLWLVVGVTGTGYCTSRFGVITGSIQGTFSRGTDDHGSGTRYTQLASCMARSGHARARALGGGPR